MIKKIHVQGFQSLKDVTIELGRFTVIVGPNDQGKSALLRALDGLLYNDAHPNSVHTGMATAAVTAHLEDNLLKWTKGARNSYLLRGEKGDKPFNKIGRTVPEEIQEVLEVKPVKLVGEELKLQYQSQFDGPIVVAKSAGVLAQLFDQLIGVGLLMKASGFCKKDLSTVQVELKQKSVQLKDLEAEGVEWIETVSEMEVIKRHSDRLTAIRFQLNIIELQEKITGVRSRLDDLKVKAGKLIEKVNELRRMVDFERRQQRIKDLKSRIDKFEACYDGEKIRDLVKRVSRGRTVVQGLVKVFRYEAQMVEIQRVRNQKEKEKGDLAYERVQWVTTVRNCPVCGLKLTAESKSRLLKYVGDDG